MNILRDIDTCKNGKILRGGERIAPSDYVEMITAGDPLQEKPAGKKRVVTVSEYYYLTGVTMPIVRQIIAVLKGCCRDVTRDGKTKLGRREFTYLISSMPAEKFYSIRICTATGKKIVICNTENYIRNPELDPAAAAGVVREIWKKYPDPSMTVAGIAEREYNNYLKEAGVYFDFRDERKERIDLYDCTLADYAYNGYFGGWCYDATGGDHAAGEGVRLDVHSLYPWAMAQGIPADRYIKMCDDEWTFNAWRENSDKGYMVHFECMFHVKQNACPFISFRNGSLITHNADCSAFEFNGKKHDRLIELWMCKPEFEAFLKLYDVKKYTFIDAVFFPIVRDAKPYIEQKYAEKQTLKGSGYAYVVSKVIMNGISGQFARKKELADLYFDADMNSETFYSDIKKPSHVLIAAWITATARARMAILAAETYDRFLYCDTDSLHLTGTTIPAGVSVSDRLGDFALEAHFEHAFYWGQKKYAEWSDDDAKVVAAGLPQIFIDAIQDQLAPRKKPARVLPLSWNLAFGAVANAIRAGRRRVSIPYKVDGTGWQLYRMHNDKYARVADDDRRALQLIENAREEAAELTGGEFWNS